MRAAHETCTWTIVRPGEKKNVENYWFKHIAYKMTQSENMVFLGYDNNLGDC